MPSAWKTAYLLTRLERFIVQLGMLIYSIARFQQVVDRDPATCQCLESYGFKDPLLC